MMLFKLSLKNIQKSFKDYAIYFFTLILGVAIFYVFNSIESQTVLMKVSSSTEEIIKLMTNMLSGVSVFVSFILGFLVIYASRFLIKRRKKEFGIYLTLGMSKRKISMILFFETLFIGIISLAIGLGLGAILSQLMSLLVVNMFEADMTKFTFVFSTSACLKTLLYFGIIYLLVMIFNTIIISKCKLIDLLHGNKLSEKQKLKNPLLCTIVFIISTSVLSYAYYLVTGGIEKLTNADTIFIPIAMGLISTFFIFWSLSGLLLKIFKSLKKTYYKGLNSFTLRQISSKVNTTVFSMSIICIMLFVTICVFSSSLSLKNSMSANLKKLSPVDVELKKEWNLTYSDFNPDILEDSKTTVRSTLEKNGFNLEKNLRDITEINLYETTNLTFKDTIGKDNFELFMKDYRFINYDNAETIIKLSDYNKVAKLYGNKTYSLKNNEYITIAEFSSMVELRNTALKSKHTITVNNQEFVSKYKKCQDGFIDISSNHMNDGIIVLPDNAIDKEMLSSNILIANYNKVSKEGQENINNELHKLMKNTWNITSLTSLNTKIDITEASVGLDALVTFIGLYLGLIFLISSAAILSLKELSDSSDNKERFSMLRKLGADEAMINKALFRQTAIFFMFPLILAIIHSIFGIKFSTFILSTFGNDKLLPSIVMTSIFLVVIYGGYFLITYFCSKNIIKEKNN